MLMVDERSCPVPQIPEGILSLPNLKRLNLGSNEIDEVSPLIERWTHLETLILSRNKVLYTGNQTIFLHILVKNIPGNL